MKYLILMLLAGCMYNGDPNLYGVDLVIDAGMETNTILVDPNFKVRLKKAIERGAQYWRMHPEELAGWRLRIKGGDVWCEGGGGYQGCTDFINFTVTITLEGASCIEMSAILHEMGHVKSYPWGDPWHWDTGWWNHQGMENMWALTQAEDLPDGDLCKRLSWGPHNYPAPWDTN